MTLDPVNRTLIASIFVLAAMLLLRTSQESLAPDPGFTLDFETDDVYGVSIIEPDRYLRLERGPSGWQTTNPEETAGPVSDETVGQLLESWQGFRTSYLAVSDDRVRHGLTATGTDPGSVLLMRFDGEAEARLVSLEIGNLLPTGERYLRRLADHAIYVGPVRTDGIYSAHAGRWLDPLGLTKIANEVTEFGLINEHGQQTFTRTDGRWTSDRGEVGQEKVDQLVRAAIELNRARLLNTQETNEAGEEAFTPTVSMWWDREGVERDVAHFGSDADSDFVYVHRATAFLFVVRKKDKAQFEIGPDELLPQK